MIQFLDGLNIFGYSIPVLVLLAGTGLMVAEALAPGAHFFVIGVALLVAGLVGIALGGVVGPLLTILAMTVAVLVTGGAALYGYRQLDVFSGGFGTGQTSDSDALRGKVGRVTERVTTTSGEVKLEEGGFNPYYRARTVDGEIAEGEEVMVVDPGGGNVVTVESMSGLGHDEIDRELARERLRREREREHDRDGDPDGEGEPETA